jgi:hypothetical protein
VGRVSRYRSQGTLDQCGDLIVIDPSRPTGASFIHKPLDAVLQKAPPSFADRVFMHAQFRSDNLALDAISAAQNDPTPLRYRARDTSAPDLPLQILAFLRPQNQSLRWPTTHVCRTALSYQEIAACYDTYFSSR